MDTDGDLKWSPWYWPGSWTHDLKCGYCDVINQITEKNLICTFTRRDPDSNRYLLASYSVSDLLCKCCRRLLSSNFTVPGIVIDRMSSNQMFFTCKRFNDVHLIPLNQFKVEICEDPNWFGKPTTYTVAKGKCSKCDYVHLIPIEALPAHVIAEISK